MFSIIVRGQTQGLPQQSLSDIGTILILILFFYQIPLAHTGTINSEIIKDFSSTTGYVVKRQTPNIFIIDLDDQDGITSGDIFSVITEKESLTHPVSEKVIGKLHDSKAFLQITQIRKGFAFSKIIHTRQNAMIQPGDRVIRYDQINARFIDYVDNGKHIYTGLVKQLPHLKWHVYEISRTNNKPEKLQSLPELYFINDKKGLEVRDDLYRLIHYYPHREIYLSSVLPIGHYDNASENIFAAIETIGKMDELILSADFLVNDNKLLMATATKTQITIYDVAPRKISSIVNKSISIQYQPIYLNWWRPNSTSKPHLTITFWHDQDIESKIFIFEKQQLQLLAYGIHYHITAYDQNHDGNPETLLGQPMDRDNFWDNRVFRLAYFDQALRLVRRFHCPYSFTVSGSTIGDLTGDGYLENIWVTRGVLRIYKGKTFLYKTYIGNTPTQQVSYDVDPTAKKSLFRNASIYPRPVIEDLNHDNLPELYTIHCERPLLNQLGFQSQSLRTWIKCIQYQNKMFYSRRISQIFNSNIQAFTIYNERFYAIMGFEDRDSENSISKIVRWDF
jgi:hypothetical protein